MIEAAPESKLDMINDVYMFNSFFYGKISVRAKWVERGGQCR